MDQEVAKTLGELELKLQELERELTTIGRSDAAAASLDVPEKLIDEVVERELAAEPTHEERSVPPPHDPAPPPHDPAPPPHDPAPPHESTTTHHPPPLHETARHPAPPHPGPQPIDRADLVRFKEKMERAMEELIAEYGRLLSPKPPS